jgi:hypothetical protein
MHVEAELDEVHAERLLRLQRQSGKPLSEIVAEMLSQSIDSVRLAEGPDESPWYQTFVEAGLLGCVETGQQLASTYKEKLDFSGKLGGSGVDC